MADFVVGGAASGVFPSGVNASAAIAGTSGIFQSGVDSSALIQGGASAVIKSGLEASATIKGTIGQFLASVLAGSGVNASGPVAAPSGVFTSEVNLSGAVKATSGLFASGINASAAVQAPSYVVTSVVVASGPVQGTSGVFASGVDASAVVKGGASGLFPSGVNASGAVQGTSGVFASGINTSGPLLIHAASAGATAGSAIVIIGAAAGATPSFALVISQANTQAYLGMLGSFVGSGDVLIAGKMSVGLSLIIQSGILVSAGTVASPGALTLSGTVAFINTNLSVNASGTFQSGLNTSANSQFTSTLTVDNTLSVVNVNVLSVLGGSGPVRVTSGVFTSGVHSSGPVQGTSGVFPSGLNTSAGAAIGANAVVVASMTDSAVTITASSITFSAATKSGLGGGMKALIRFPFLDGRFVGTAPSSIDAAIITLTSGMNFGESGLGQPGVNRLYLQNAASTFTVPPSAWTVLFYQPLLSGFIGNALLEVGGWFSATAEPAGVTGFIGIMKLDTTSFLSGAIVSAVSPSNGIGGAFWTFVSGFQASLFTGVQSLTLGWGKGASSVNNFNIIVHKAVLWIQTSA